MSCMKNHTHGDVAFLALVITQEIPERVPCGHAHKKRADVSCVINGTGNAMAVPVGIITQGAPWSFLRGPPREGRHVVSCAANRVQLV